MILIYPLLNDSRDNYTELRYSLRSFLSIYPYATPLLVGGKPKWYDGLHIYHKDYGPVRKEENIRDKVKAGVEYFSRLNTGFDNIGSCDQLDNVNLAYENDFMLCNDDHFIIHPVESVHHKGLMTENMSRRVIGTSYYRTMKNTVGILGDHINDYDTHQPMKITAEGLSKLPAVWPQWGYCLKTMYCYLNKITGHYYQDCKFQDIPAVIDRPYFSTHDGVTGLYRLDKLWPKKSKYEKDNFVLSNEPVAFFM